MNDCTRTTLFFVEALLLPATTNLCPACDAIYGVASKHHRLECGNEHSLDFLTQVAHLMIEVLALDDMGLAQPGSVHLLPHLLSCRCSAIRQTWHSFFPFLKPFVTRSHLG